MNARPSWLTDDLVARASPDGIWVFDERGRVQFADARAASLLGRAPDELPGASLYDLVRPSWRGATEELVAHAVSGEASFFELCCERHDGGEVWLELTTVAGGGGGCRWSVAQVRDVTDKKRAEQERDACTARLQQAEQGLGASSIYRAELVQAGHLEALGELARGAAHDINNLIAVIASSVHLARRDTSSSARRDRNLDSAKRASSEAGQVTRRLLDLAQPRPGRARAMRLEDVLADREALLGSLVGEGVTLTMDLAEQAWPVSVDPAQLDSLLVHLVANARGAMPQGGEVVVRTAPVTLREPMNSVSGRTMPGDYMCLSVVDSGTGMDPDTCARAFMPFFTTRRREGGTGLGLPACLAIVESAGGAIAVDTAPGQGTTVAIYLPRAEEPGSLSAGP